MLLFHFFEQGWGSLDTVCYTRYGMIFEEKRDSKKILQCVKTIYQGALFNFTVAYQKPLFYHNVYPKQYQS